MPLDLDALLSAPLDLGVMPSELDKGVAWRAAIGLVVLATDQTMEHEFRALLRLPGVAVFESRVFNDNDIRPETLRAIGPRIAPSVALILPGVGLHVGDDDSRRGCGVRRDSQGAARRRVHDAGHRRACRVPRARREVDRAPDA